MAKRPEYTPPFDPDTMRQLKALNYQNPLGLQEIDHDLEQHKISQLKDQNIRFFMGEIVAFFEREPHAASQGVQIDELFGFLCPNQESEGSFSRALMWLRFQGVLQHNDELRLTYSPQESPDSDF